MSEKQAKITGQRKSQKTVVKKSALPLVGLWFHSKGSDGKIQWQGRVMGTPYPGYFLVLLFNWLDGTRSSLKIVPVADLLNWDFYLSDADMRYAYHKANGGSEEDWEAGERVNTILHGGT